MITITAITEVKYVYARPSDVNSVFVVKFIFGKFVYESQWNKNKRKTVFVLFE